MRDRFRSRLVVAGMLGAAAFSILIVGLPRVVAQDRFDAEGRLVKAAPISANERFSQLFDVIPDKIEIAPMVTGGEPTPGTWTTVANGFFDGILARAGILPGASDPEHLQGRPGFLEYIDKSGVLNPEVVRDGEVVNPGGTRATFGYFVRARGRSLRETAERAALGGGGLPGSERCVEAFILMSYDAIKGQNLNAFEVFVFGPLSRSDSGGPPLADGLAVNDSGQLLTAVPLTIARVSNYRGNKVSPDKPVTPGVNNTGQGCFECHSRDGEFPATTLPFPWVPGSSQALKLDPPELAIDCSNRTATAPSPPPPKGGGEPSVQERMAAKPKGTDAGNAATSVCSYAAPESLLSLPFDERVEAQRKTSDALAGELRRRVEAEAAAGEKYRKLRAGLDRRHFAIGGMSQADFDSELSHLKAEESRELAPLHKASTEARQCLADYIKAVANAAKAGHGGKN